MANLLRHPARLLAEYDPSEVAWTKSEILIKTSDVTEPTFVRRIQTGNIDKWNRLPLIDFLGESKDILRKGARYFGGVLVNYHCAMALLPPDVLRDNVRRLSLQHREIPPGYALVAQVDNIQSTQLTDHASLHQSWLGYERWKRSNPSAGHWEDNHREQFVFGYNPASRAQELIMVDPDHLIKPANM